LIDPTFQVRGAKVLRNTVTGGLGFGLRRVGFNLNGSHNMARFLDAPDLIGAQTLGGSAGMNFTVGRSNSMNMSYGYRHTYGPSFEINGHNADIGWSRPLGRKFSMQTSIGLGQTITAGENPLYGTGQLVVSYNPREGHLSVRVSRRISHAYGLGRDHLADRASLSYSRPLTRSLSWSVGASYAVSRDPLDPSYKAKSQTATTSVSFPFAERFAASANYHFIRSEAKGSAESPAALAHAATVSLTWGYVWH
jgi:hypothetical protein